MTFIRLVRHRHFTADLADSGVTLFHWHREWENPECHVVGPPVSMFTTLEELEAMAAAHLVGHSPLQEDDGGEEPPILVG